MWYVGKPESWVWWRLQEQIQEPEHLERNLRKPRVIVRMCVLWQGEGLIKDHGPRIFKQYSVEIQLSEWRTGSMPLR